MQKSCNLETEEYLHRYLIILLQVRLWAKGSPFTVNEYLPKAFSSISSTAISLSWDEFRFPFLAGTLLIIRFRPEVEWGCSYPFKLNFTFNRVGNELRFPFTGSKMSKWSFGLLLSRPHHLSMDWSDYVDWGWLCSNSSVPRGRWFARGMQMSLFLSSSNETS